MKNPDATIDRLECVAYRVPTDAPEGDGTLTWGSTTLIVVTIDAADMQGVGYTYADVAASHLIAGLQEEIIGGNALDISALVNRLSRKIRNSGRSGLAACAISAIDLALSDLKAKLLDLPLCQLLGRSRDQVDIYGSGGFTTYTDAQLTGQLAGWVDRDGCRAVKMKVGADPAGDKHRVAVARKAIGDTELFIDANGAFTPGEAVRFVCGLEDFDIRWFEEPVTSDDPAGLRLVREQAPKSVEIAAGEYIFTLENALQLLATNAVDVLQADVTRCGGVTGFMKVAALSETFHLDLSGHCAPAAHLSAGAKGAGREVSASRDRASRLRRHLAWSEGVEWRGHPLSRPGAARNAARPSGRSR